MHALRATYIRALVLLGPLAFLVVETAGTRHP